VLWDGGARKQRYAEKKRRGRPRGSACARRVLIQLHVVMYVARITDKEGTRSLTEAEYNGLDFGKYTWAINGHSDPPKFHRGRVTGSFGVPEFNAFARMIRAPGKVFPSRRRPGLRADDASRGLLESASADSADTRLYRERKKLEPSAPRRGGSFPTVESKDDKQFTFSPGAGVNWCLVERIHPSEQASPNLALQPPARLGHLVAKPQSAQWAHLWDFGPDGLAAAMKASKLQVQLDVGRPELKLTRKTQPAVFDEISVQTHSLRVLGRRVLADVTITNPTAKPKLIGYFTLHVGGQVLRARPQEPSRRRARGRKRLLKPEKFLIDRKATGVLAFRRPRIGGEAEVRACMVIG
jgi:hypothetical protein